MIRQDTIHILICDDEPLYCEEIRKICQKCLSEQKLENYKLTEAHTGSEALTCIQKNDILILDIDMPEMDGIQVKEHLQLQQNHSTILYISNHTERMKSAFGRQVYAFIDKAEMDQELPYKLEKILSEYNTYILINEKYISSDLHYIQSAHNYSELHFKTGEIILISEKISDLEALLFPVDFIRCHRSYLVNMREIAFYDKDGIKIDTGTEKMIELPISTRMKKTFQECYQKYKRKRMGYI